MNTGLKPLALTLAVLASPAIGQVFTIWAEAPEAVNPGETYTVEFWGSVEGEPWVDDESAVAGFGIDALGLGQIADVSPATIAEWAESFGTEGTVDGVSVRGISGGQIAQIFCCWPVDRRNPIPLFTIQVEAGNSTGAITYTPGNPSPNGGLSFYPHYQDGATIIAPNDPGTTLVLVGATTRIVPVPATLGLVFAGLWCPGRRRRK